jgi:plastocyanin
MNISTVQTASQPIASPTPRPFYKRVAALGYILIALTGIISTLVGLINGNTEEISFTLPILVIGLLLAGAIWRFGTWALVVGGILALLVLVLLVPFSTFTLSHPESASEFIPLVLLVAGALLAVVGAVVLIVQGRRHTLRMTATPNEAMALKVFLGVVAVLILASLVMTMTTPRTVSADTRAGATVIDQKNFSFSPSAWTVKSGETVRFVVRNGDSTLHSFTLDDAKVNVAIPPGTERLIEFKAPAAGSYVFYCIPHSDASTGMRTGMTGVLVVQ